LLQLLAKHVGDNRSAGSGAQNQYFAHGSLLWFTGFNNNPVDGCGAVGLTRRS
jgi:hypothetical protein